MEQGPTRFDEATNLPLCPSCGQPMCFKRAVPRFAALPELRTYECKSCAVSYTAAVEPTADSAES